MVCMGGRVPFSVQQLRYFVAVAEAGQVSAAARELYVSQSTVTMAVQEIERVLQRPAFVRGSRGVALTETGIAFLPKARQILQLMDEAAMVTTTDTAMSGRVTVGVTYTVMAYFLPHHIQRLSVLFPNLDVAWREMGRPDVEKQLVDGELDFGLVLTSNLRSAELQHATFVHSKRRLWMTPNHPLADLAEIHLADVAPFPYVQLTVDEAAGTTRDYWGETRRSVFVETTSIEAVRSIVANGNGVTILSDMVYRPWSLEGKRVHTAELADPVPDMRIGLAWRRGTPLNPEMAVLYDYFDRQFGVATGSVQPLRG